MTLAHLHTCPRCEATFDCILTPCEPQLWSPCATCRQTCDNLVGLMAGARMTAPLALTPLFDFVYQGTWFTVNRLPREGKRKTDTYEVLTKECDVIAHVKWYGPWRKYCYFPAPEIVMEADCMREIADLLTQLTREQLTRNKQRKTLA